ncbi:MAG: ABC transporter ATP-binding protein [Pseudanabaenaceae cyanobacterium SKYGB_i_bin29]|nr:ABC transporter ATP-binding protein [Pseudanabaenaceae cyanobacterium SKYG29]MDW8420299.1 ABC transporter ATP-binding protein [Pseudanabaenaceae cyanobacterium SKYGB_i_bin29]
MDLLVLDKVSRRFGGLIALQDVSFVVAAGEIFGLIGPNGAGKTTLFNIITGVIEPSSGRLFLRGEDITTDRSYHLAQKGMARTFQNIRLFRELSVLENVMIGHHLRRDLTSRQVRESSLELLALMGLGDRYHLAARSLSYGEQRRLEIARALAVQPQLLLLDEPAAGMNPKEKLELSNLIQDLRQRFNLTILLIEHHVPLVMSVCDRIGVLNFGELIALGTPAEIKENPQVISAYLGTEAGISYFSD